MTLRLCAGWDCARVNMSIYVTEATGPSSFTVALTSGTYSHESQETYLGTGLYASFAVALKAALEAASPNVWTYTVSFNTSTGKYTISATGNTALTFSTLSTAGTNMRLALGFSGDKTSAASHTSANASYYFFSSTAGGKAEVSDDYEPADIVTGAYADSGAVYSVAPTSAPLQYDFRIPFETKTKTLSRFAASTVPWTLEHLGLHCHADQPILVTDDIDNASHYIRPEGASWQPVRAMDGYDGYWHADLKTYVFR